MYTFEEFRKKHANELVEAGEKFINKSVKNSDLAEAMNYSFIAGGKRIRPMLFLAVLQTFGIKNISAYYELASSIEMIHTYSLIHDDLPEMDNDDLRRGKSTNHKVFGTGSAVLAGDALLTMAFNVISNNNVINDSQKIKLISSLSEKSGAQGMISGQWIDINNENNKLGLDQLKHLHNQKTGDLLLSSVEMALNLIEISKNDYSNMIDFARNIGLAFQVKDDILDITSSAKEQGKNTQKDVSEGKNTFPAIIGLDKSILYLNELQKNARKNLTEISVETKLFDDFLNYFN